LADVRVFAKISEELESSENVFVTVRASRLVVVMVMVMVTRGSKDNFGGNGKRERALYGGVRSDCCFRRIIALSIARETDIHRTGCHVRRS